MELVSVGCIMYHIVVSYVYVADVPRIEKEGFGQFVFRSTRTPNQKKICLRTKRFRRNSKFGATQKIFSRTSSKVFREKVAISFLDLVPDRHFRLFQFRHFRTCDFF